MNKSDLIDAIASKTGGTKTDADAHLTATLAAITEAVAGGDKVSIPGFGSFEVRENAAREGRNPATGEAMQIKASKSPKFKPAKPFKDALN